MDNQNISRSAISPSHEVVKCFHCGEDCPDHELAIEEKYFCCIGCQSVYELLNKTGLCAYYDLNSFAGTNRRNLNRSNKFAYLEEDSIRQSLVQFEQHGQTHITFHIPQIHCSSCIYLLENLHRIAEGIVRADIQFLKKEVRIIFNEQKISLREVVETLSSIGYEPHISLRSTEKKKFKLDRSLIYQLGVAGFCFGNIMLLSFPEYFASDANQEAYLGNIFRYLNVILALPVFFYSAQPFFISAWKGIKHKHLNIDVPVALAILATFIRSLTEVFFGTGGGYFDSMAGIVFYMLVGRVLQNKTYGQLSFDRDYTDYFPIAATVINKEDKEIPTPISQLKIGDTIRVHNNELIIADGILVKGKAQIDYSFVTGESVPDEKNMGDMIYAGGLQLGGAIEILVMKEVAQSYLTGLWNKEMKQKDDENNHEKKSFVHRLAMNFTWIVLAISLVTAIYWWQHDPSKIWPSVTAILIIACPCGLLLTSTFTNGYIIRILGKNGLYLRNAHVIEPFGKLSHIVFDKTGTLTSAKTISATFHGEPLSNQEKNWVASFTVPTLHSLAKSIRKLLNAKELFPVKAFSESAGLGAHGYVQGQLIKIGTATYMGYENPNTRAQGTLLYLEINNEERGYFELTQLLRPGIKQMVTSLKNKVSISLLSGDKPYQENYLRQSLGNEANIMFEQPPYEKLKYIKQLQGAKEVVAMIGDGLNDAGALKQSDVGICIAEHTNNFTPAGDAILEGKYLKNLNQLMLLCSRSKNIIKACFAFSLIYNITGIYFAVQGLLSPLIAAILMPSSTLTIVAMTYMLSRGMAKNLGLK